MILKKDFKCTNRSEEDCIEYHYSYEDEIVFASYIEFQDAEEQYYKFYIKNKNTNEICETKTKTDSFKDFLFILNVIRND